MDIIVQKFGGSSVANPELITKAAKKAIKAKEDGYGVVVVVSAMGKTTDNLLELTSQISSSPPPREMDMLLATGEQVTISLYAIAVHASGHEAISFTGPQVNIVTDNRHGRAKIKSICKERIFEELQKGKIVVVAGFQGITENNDITTLGRGGSDTTAVALAVSLDAKECDIYTDVDGVYTADPRIVHNARKLKTISYDEMLELASVGAKVLHSRAVEFAKKFDMPLHVRSSFLDTTGTYVTKEEKSMEKVLVSGIACEKNEAKVSILEVPDRPGIAAALFQNLASKQIVVDMIIKNVSEGGRNDISFTVVDEDLEAALNIAKEFQGKYDAKNVIWDKSVAKISVVGVGMKSHSGVAAMMFQALANKGINIDMISTSEIKISCIIPLSDADKAVKSIHETFHLADNIEFMGDIEKNS